MTFITTISTQKKKLAIFFTVFVLLFFLIPIVFFTWFLTSGQLVATHRKATDLSGELKPAVDLILSNNIEKYEVFVLPENSKLLCKTLTVGQKNFINDLSCDIFDDREFEVFDKELGQKFSDLQRILNPVNVDLTFVEKWPEGKKSVHFHFSKEAGSYIPKQIIYKPDHDIGFYQVSHADIYYSINKDWYYHAGRIN